VAGKTLIQLSQQEQEGMLKELRKGRYGYLLALHVLLLCAAGYSPTLIAAVMFCSRTSVYRIVKQYQEGKLGLEYDEEGKTQRPVRTKVLIPYIKKKLLEILKQAPCAYGWCRSRWSCATLAIELKVQIGLEVSAETVRRWMGEIGWVFKRAKLTTLDNDPQRTEKLAKIRSAYEDLVIEPKSLMFFADELDIHLLAKVGYQWMEKGTQEEVMTPGKNEKNYLAGALNILTGEIIHCIGLRKTSALFLQLLELLNSTYPKDKFSKIYIALDNYIIHKTKAVDAFLANNPRFELLFLPSYCPKSNPIERAFGDVHDKCTRNHKRSLLADLLLDVQNHLQFNGPWLYRLSHIYFDSSVTRTMVDLARQQFSRAA
jgi:transposase